MAAREKFVKNLRWPMIQQISAQIINYLSLILLANLVLPEEFGILTISTVLVGLVESINGFGIGQTIIKDQIEDIKKISSLFWVALIISFCLFLLCNVFGVLYSYFYSPENFKILFITIFISSFGILFNGINAVIGSVFYKDLNFKLGALSYIFAFTIGNFIALAIAYNGFGVSALVTRNILPIFLLSIIYIYFIPQKILFYLRKNDFKEIVSFSSYLSLFNIANYFSRNLDYLIIGKFFDFNIVGQYSLAYKIMIFPIKNLSSIIQLVLFPTLSQLKTDVKKIGQIYLKISQLISAISFPIMVILSLTASIWVNLLFNEKFHLLIPLVQILSIVGAFQAVTSPVGSLYLISGNTRIMFQISLIISVCTLATLLIGGLTGNVYYFAGLYALNYIFINFPISNFFPLKVFKINKLSFLNKVGVPFIASLLLVLIYLIFNLGQKMSAISLLFYVPTGILVYLLFIHIGFGGSLKENIKKISNFGK